jgi:hypothetical protein
MVAEGVSAGGTASAALPAAALPERIKVLLIEDDDGDALLVEELLLDAGEPFLMTRARSLADARHAAGDAGCGRPVPGGSAPGGSAPGQSPPVRSGRGSFGIGAMVI